MLQPETLKLKPISKWQVNCEFCVAKLCAHFIAGPPPPPLYKGEGFEGSEFSLKKGEVGKTNTIRLTITNTN